MNCICEISSNIDEIFSALLLEYDGKLLSMLFLLANKYIYTETTVEVVHETQITSLIAHDHF